MSFTLKRTYSGKQPGGIPDSLDPIRAKDLLLFVPFNGHLYDLIKGGAFTLAGTGALSTSGGRAASLRSGAAAATGSIAVDLSSTNILTIMYWMKWDTNADDDALAMEHSATALSNAGFIIDPNNGAPTGVFGYSFYDGLAAGNSFYTFARPTAGAWHHIAIQFDGSQSSKSTSAWVDGTQQAVTVDHETGSTGNFGSFPLYLFSRNNTSLFGAGNIQDLKIYGRYLQPLEIMRDYHDTYGIFLQRGKIFPYSSAGLAATTATTASTAATLDSGIALKATLVSSPGATAALAGSTKIIINLVNRADVGWVSLTGLRYSVWSETNENSLATKLASGSSGTTDANGQFNIDVSTGSTGQSVYLLLGDSSGRRYAGVEVLV